MAQKFWTKEEDTKLLEAYNNLPKTEKVGKRTKGGIVRKGASVVFQELLPDRSYHSIHCRLRLLRTGKAGNALGRSGYKIWSEEDSKKLLAAYEQLPKRSNGALRRGGLEQLMALFPDRDGAAIYDRVFRLRHPRAPQEKRFRYNYNEWTDEEVAKLREVYARDEFKLNLKAEFPDRKSANVVAKAIQLGLSRRRLSVVPFHLTNEERALAAGLILGDGYITFSDQRGLNGKSAAGNRLSISCGFVNAEKEMVDWFAEKIPRGRVTADDQRHLDSPIRHKLVVYRWTLADKPTLAYFLEMIYPYLIGVKKERAKLILEELVPVIANDIAESYLKAS